MNRIKEADIIPDRDFSFQMDMRRSNYPWFDLSVSDGKILGEKRAVLESNQDKHLVYTTGADPIIADLSAKLGLAANPEGKSGLKEIALRWEPDFVLLKRISGYEPEMAAGVVCFPSAWDPREKIGRKMSEIHSPVPGMNHLHNRVNNFLNKIDPDVSYERWNWGIAATSLRNRHPESGYPQADENTAVSDLYLWNEHQGFAVLPGSNGVVFMIRPVFIPITEVKNNEKTKLALIRQLETVPPEVAEYKGLTPIRLNILEFLRK